VFQDGGVAHARIEPDIEDVRFLLELCTTALWAACPCRHQFLRLTLKPDVGAVLPDKPDDVVQDLLRHELAVAPLQ